MEFYVQQRIAITGLGVFCSAGKDVASFRESLFAGQSGIGPIDLFDVAPFTGKLGAQVRGYDPLTYFSGREAGKLSRADQFAVIAAGEALAASGIQDTCSPYDIGISVGAGAAGMLQGERWLQAKVAGTKAQPSLLRGILPDRTATALAGRFNLCGYQGTVTTACSSSATAIGWGSDLVATGRLKAAVCGGTDALSLLTFSGFSALRIVDPQPCSPFSLGRQGITLGEGAAFMVLEREEDARERGARIYGYILGYAMAGEAFHMTAPDTTAATPARVMQEAISFAGIDPARIGWVNAHGTGTPLNDVVESNAMKLVFAEYASSVPLISTKGMTGHCLGAAGAIEALATVLALDGEIIPATLNFRGLDPECDLDYGHRGPRPNNRRVAMSNSFAFGGNITSLVIGGNGEASS